MTTEKIVFKKIEEHVNASGPKPNSVFGLGQRILDAVRSLLGGAEIDVEVVVAAAKKFYDEQTAGDNPSIPNILEPVIERIIWNLIEGMIRRLFTAPVAPGAT
jgi:hypothetical protein